MLRSRPLRRIRNAGLFAGALALGLLWAVSRADDALPFAPLSLGDRIIRLTPGDAATFAIDTLGTTASHALAVTITILFLAIAAVLPAATADAERPRPGLCGALFAALLFGAGILAPVAPSMIAAAAVAVLAGAAYGASLWWIVRQPSGTAATQDADRRRALLWIGSSALALALGGSALGRRRNGDTETGVVLRRPRRGLAPAADDALADIPGLSPQITTVAEHYVVDINIVNPKVDAVDWRLEIGGQVDRPARYGTADLQRDFEVVEQASVLTCISNEVGGKLVGNAAWTGVLLRDVLMAAGVRRGAVDVVFRCADGYDVSIPIRRALQSTALLALGQNGRPLTRDHGSPCRVRVPALYGMMNAKWVVSIELVKRNHRGYWAKRGWSEVGEVRTQSRIDTPSAARAGESTWIAGVAWAGDREISAVEVSVDDGVTWRRAQLQAGNSPVSWTRWALRWTPETAGTAVVQCRASDGRGRRQGARRSLPHPDGAAGYHRIEVVVAS